MSIEVISDLSAVKNILKSDDSFVINLANSYEYLGKRLGIDFMPTQRMLNTLPVFLNGSSHKYIRGEMARLLVKNNKELEFQLEVFIKQKVGNFTVGQKIDILNELVLPLWSMISKKIISDLYLENFHNLANEIPLLFNSYLSLKKRLQINQQLRQLIDENPNSYEKIMIQLGLASLGSRPFIGSICMSLYDVFSKNSDTSLKDIIFPEHMMNSALPVTDRVNGLGEVKRCVINSSSFSESQKIDLMFGAGVHVCIGRPITNFVWDKLIQELSFLNLVIRSTRINTIYTPEHAKNNFALYKYPFIGVKSFTLDFY